MTTITVQVEADAARCQTRRGQCRFLAEIPEYGEDGERLRDSRWACQAFDFEGCIMELGPDERGVPLRCEECLADTEEVTP